MKTWKDIKPGDKVKVKPGISPLHDYEFSFTDFMSTLAGQVFSVKSIEKYTDPSFYKHSANYKIYLVENDYIWSDAMLEIVQDNSNQITIDIPEGMEIDEENSTFTCIKFKSKQLSILDIQDKLKSQYEDFCVMDMPIATSMIGYNKIMAISQLMAVAKYLNDGWVPDWKDKYMPKYYIVQCGCNNVVSIDEIYTQNSELVHFKSKKLAQKAIDILGEDTIKTALSSDY